MALSVEKLLTDAHSLILRLKDEDSMADNIIASTQALFLTVEAKKQYQDDITELNEIAKHRPRSTLVLGIAQENRQIRELQQENRELQATLEDHQSALELIMQKYREHTVKLLQSSRLERAIQEKELADKNSMCHLMDKIDEMAGVMQKAIEVDETTGCADQERLSQLVVENRALRELLEICTTSKERIVPPEVESPAVPGGEDGAAAGATAAAPDKDKSQTEGEEEEDNEDDEDTANEEEDDTDSSESSQTLVSPPAKSKDSEESPEKKVCTTKKSPEPSAGKKEGKESPAPAAKGGKTTPQGKASTDVKKAKTPQVKKTVSSTVTTKKDSAPVRKSPSVDTKKDVRGKPAVAKSAAKK